MTQYDSKTLLFATNKKDVGQEITGIVDGNIESIHNLTVNLAGAGIPGGINAVESAIHGIKDYTDDLGTSGEEATPTVEVSDFVGGVNGSSLVAEIPEYQGLLSTVGEEAVPKVEHSEFRGRVNGSSLVAEVPEYQDLLSTVGEESAPKVEHPEFTGGVNSALALFEEKEDYRGGVNAVASAVHDIEDYTGSLATAGDSVVKSTDKQVDNRESENEANSTQVIPRLTSSQRIFKNGVGSVQIQASEEVLKNVKDVQIQEVKVSALSSLNYKAYDIQLNDASGKAVQPKGKVLVTFAADQSVENVYYVDSEGNLHSLEFVQKDGKIIFETNHFSIYAMTFRLSLDNVALDNPTKDKKEEGITPSLKLLSTNQHSESNQSENRVSNNEQTMLPNTGEDKSISTVLLGFVSIILGVIISYSRKDSED